MTLAPAVGLDPSRLLDAREIESAYQPIVDLATHEVVAVEALARWPRLGISPADAFAACRAAGAVAELDAACQRAAIRGASGLTGGICLFVNVEPGNHLAASGRARGSDLVAEITERDLLQHPAAVLATVQSMRRSGCGIALDDVGAQPDSLALLPFIAPDVIKLDVSLVQSWPDRQQAAILTAVASYAEESAAVVLAEGIETEAQRRQALALGATLGQGWLFDRPGPLRPWPAPRQPLSSSSRPTAQARTGELPSAVLGATARVAPKGMLLEISRHIEEQAAGLMTPPVVLGAFQSAERFSPATASRYARLASSCALVGAVGAGLGPEPAPGVRGADLHAGDAMAGEWTVVVVAPHYQGALIARDLGDEGPDLERRFRFAITHDPHNVLLAARILLEKVTARR